MKKLGIHLCVIYLVMLWTGTVVVVSPRWSMDISLDSSVVEHLTSDVGVWGSIPCHVFSFVFIPSSHPYYTVKIQDPLLTGIGHHLVPQSICY